MTALRSDPGLGPVGVFRLTEAGAEAVNSREYRFVSVCWFLGDDGRPFKLDSVALTNRPNLPVRPVLNRVAQLKKLSDEAVKAPQPLNRSTS